MNEIKEMFETIDRHRDKIGPYQVDFVAGLRKYYKRNKGLSERQKQALNDIIKYCIYGTL
jgi:hypothetical protein